MGSLKASKDGWMIRWIDGWMSRWMDRYHIIKDIEDSINNRSERVFYLI